MSAGLLALAQWLHGGVWPLGATFTRWDGAWYYSIVQDGYGTGSLHGQVNVAFFPLYPLLVTGVQALFRLPGWVAGVSVSVAAFVAALVLLYNLVARCWGNVVARWSVLLLAFNPFGLFFVFIYTESLYLLLSVAVFWALERRRWWTAAMAAGLASATRPQGLLLGLVVVTWWGWQTREAWRQSFASKLGWLMQGISLALVSAAGLLAFAAYLQGHNGDALAFAHVQVYWGRVGVTNLWPSLHEFIRGTLHHTINHAILFSDTVWYGSIVAGLIGGGLLVWQREYWYAAYVFLGVTAPLTSGGIEGMDRYGMVLFPIYIAVAGWLGRAGRVLAVTASGLAFALFWLIYLDPRQLFFG